MIKDFNNITLHCFPLNISGWLVFQPSLHVCCFLRADFSSINNRLRTILRLLCIQLQCLCGNASCVHHASRINPTIKAFHHARKTATFLRTHHGRFPYRYTSLHIFKTISCLCVCFFLLLSFSEFFKHLSNLRPQTFVKDWVISF